MQTTRLSKNKHFVKKRPKKFNMRTCKAYLVVEYMQEYISKLFILIPLSFF